MAGHDDGDRVPIVRHADRPESLRLPDGACDVGVRTRFAVGDVQQSPPAPHLEWGAAQVEGKRELPALAREIFVELASKELCFLRGFFPEKVPVFLRWEVPTIEFESHEPFFGDGEVERTDR